MNLHRFFQPRSISFRLYLIIIPTTIVAISLLGYIDGRVAKQMLDDQVEESSLRIATQLADDLSRKDAPTNPDSIRNWLGELVESNFYILRIAVYHVSGSGVTRFVTTSTSPAQPIAVDEMAAIRESKPKVVRQFQERERFLKVIAPIKTPAGTTGCVTVTSTLKQSDLVGEVHDRITLFMVPDRCPGSDLGALLPVHQDVDTADWPADSCNHTGEEWESRNARAGRSQG